MKLVMDEKLKHRLIGLAVIISLGAIFAPAVMKKSSQHLDNNFSVNVKLPPKPIAPNVVITDEKDVFKTIKVAKVAITPVDEKPQGTEIVKAERISPDLNSTQPTSVASRVENDVQSEPIRLALNDAARTKAKHTIQVAAAKPSKRAPVVAVRQKTVVKAKPAVKSVRIAKAPVKAAVKQDIYAVQLASFSQVSNAQALVSRLRSKGYKANFAKISGRGGPVYKVYVGHSPRKLEVMKLKTQLASSMQLNGFVVNTGVS